MRQARGWTQRDLAKTAGYSTRLIQKAESGGSLSPETLKVLAQTFSDDRQVVTIDQLTSHPEAVVREFIKIVNKHLGDAVENARHLLADDFHLWCAGDPTEMPIAGDWHGIERAAEFYKVFFSFLTPCPEGLIRNVRFATTGSTVVCWAEVYASVQGMPETPVVWCVHRYEVRDDKITRFENYFDTLAGSQHLAEARARSLLEE